MTSRITSRVVVRIVGTCSVAGVCPEGSCPASNGAAKVGRMSSARAYFHIFSLTRLRRSGFGSDRESPELYNNRPSRFRQKCAYDRSLCGTISRLLMPGRDLIALPAIPTSRGDDDLHF